MWRFLGSLVTGFLLLRDFFGYVIPGLAFIAMVGPLLSRNPMESVIASPNWISVIVLLGTSYLAGHVLAALGFIVLYPERWRQEREPTGHGHHSRKRPEHDAKSLEEALYYRYVYPQLFTELDRRDTIQLLRIALSVALLLGGIINLGACLAAHEPAPLPYLAWIGAALAGAILLWNAKSGKDHIGELRRATVAAAKHAEGKGLPAFTWNDGQDSAKNDEESAAAKG